MPTVIMVLKYPKIFNKRMGGLMGSGVGAEVVNGFVVRIKYGVLALPTLLCYQPKLNVCELKS